jgi:hypothetical protein
MNSIQFKEVQRFNTWWAWAGVAALNVFFIYAFVQQVILGKQFGEKPAPDIVLILLVVLFLALLYFLTRIKLSTSITDKGITYRFSPFQLKETCIEWHELNDAYMRQYNSLHEFGGWGIRYGNKKTGRALNTSASSNIGLQLKFIDGRLLLIGTARPDELGNIIDKITAAGKINRNV